jgi:predicted MFS family arabinose efflux permease
MIPGTMQSGFSADERRFLAGMGLVLGLRQVVLLLPLPIVAIYGMSLDGGTPISAGFALGVFGLLQAVLQIPFGRASDLVGRKTIVLAGTALLVAGLVMAAIAQNIALFAAGRALQGAGAITGTAYAWIGDHTSAEKQSRAIGSVSLAVAIAAVASFVCGPLLYGVLSAPAIFLICAGFAALSLIYVSAAMPDSTKRPPADAAPIGLGLRNVAGMSALLTAGFLANYVLMAVCFVLPLVVDSALGADGLWKILVPGTIIGILAMRQATRLADGRHFKAVSTLSFAAFLPAALCLLVPQALVLALGATLFMAGYFSLFALLPAVALRKGGSAARGAVSSALQSAMFMGLFAGGAVSGILWNWRPDAASYGIAVAGLAGLFSVLSLAPSTLVAAAKETA